MRIFIRKLLSKVLSKELKSKFKEFEYKNKKKLIEKLPPLDEEKMKNILVDKLGIKKGDHLFIHGSMDMINTELSPLQVLEMLLEIVEEDGSVSVPTFIRYSSKEWMEMDKKFDIKKIPSGMGIFSERVRRNKSAKRSLHPTKSVATIGKIADDVLNEHHLDIYQFGEKSPFVKLLDYDVKVIGLGAPMSYLSMVHTVEDVYPSEYPEKINEDKIYEKICIDENKEEVLVKTLVHNLKAIAKANPEKFVKKYMNTNDYMIYNHYLTPFFIVKGKELFKELEKQMRLGNTIYD
jgi:aminoglycoside 3-N-acetyltransferase